MEESTAVVAAFVTMSCGYLLLKHNRKRKRRDRRWWVTSLNSSRGRAHMQISKYLTRAPLARDHFPTQLGKCKYLAESMPSCIHFTCYLPSNLEVLAKYRVGRSYRRISRINDTGPPRYRGPDVSNKRQVTLWSYINYPIEESQKIGKVLAPTTVVADFEEAIHQSVTDTWANVYVSLDVDLIWVNHEKLPEIRKSLEKAKFISLDLEFSALQPLQQQAPRLFDSNKERYAKLRLNLVNVIPVQVGITAFRFDNETEDYFGEDLMIMINNFETALPESYTQYKALTNSLFPTIFDTKTIYYELRPIIPKDKLPEDHGLEGLFEYFKNGSGRHLVVNSTAIECNIEPEKLGSYHEAGWDSFCAGYVFLRMAYYNISQHYPKSKKFVSSEVISGLSEHKNRVNVIRGASSHVRIDGEDPTSSRPPWLIVESLKNEPVDVSDLMSMFSSYGFVDIKKLSARGDRVLVAVDNYRAARDISKTFKENSKFQVKQYNALKHSPVARALLLSAVTISGTFLLWLTHSMVKR
ncbi:hypothetical protein GEV33_012928 [Tenebrio molitor]|uniref:Uncharacterized protein n=1 Tax=Tenebrio molitor TaxID=7067 RepID=A0A8J6H8M3_TENMO|nr:hypothetical protein GEV33_012928 [Tenebrio molitor]